MPPLPTLSPLRLTAILGTAVLALLVVACAMRTPSSAPPQTPQPAPGTAPQATPQTPAPAVPAAPGAAAPTPAAPQPGQPPAPSQATTAKTYRVDAARHLYALNAGRIYKGTLPPNLYSIGVLEVDIDRRGQVTATRWLRPPRRAEVTTEILRTVRAAAPYPVPNRMFRVTYTDTWLWDQSGHFQLDTLTEGQR